MKGFRRMIRIDGEHLTPVTLSLLGCNGTFIGIKVVIFDPNNITESGFFLTVRQKDWLKDGCETILGKNKDKKVKKTKLRTNYTLADHLTESGVTKIIKMLVIGKKTHGLYIETPFNQEN